MHRFLLRLSLALAGALLVLGTFAATSIAADKWVTMHNNSYLPAGAVTITAGDKVTWVNDDDVPHDAVGRGWSTPLLNKGDSHAIRFTKAGTYRFTCTIHPEMTGRVVVRAAGGGGLPTVPPASTAPESPPAPAGDAAPAALAILAATAVAFGLALRRVRGPRD